MSGIEKTVKIEGGEVEIVSGDEVEKGAVMPAVKSRDTALGMKMAIAAEADIIGAKKGKNLITVISFCDGRIVEKNEFFPVTGSGE